MHHNQGFSIIELIVTMAVAFTGIPLAVSAGQSMLTSNRLTTSANQIFEDLFRARSEAILRNTRITLRKTGAHWEDGWIMFEDGNNNARRDPGEPLLQARPALSGGVTLRGNRPVRQYISYLGTGLTQKTSGALQAGALMLCDKTARNQPEHARAMILASSGRPRVSREPRDLNKRKCLY